MTLQMTADLTDYIAEEKTLNGHAIAIAADYNLDGVSNYELMPDMEAKITRKSDGETMILGVECNEEGTPVAWSWGTFADDKLVDVGNGIAAFQSSWDFSKEIATTIANWAK